MTLMEMVKQQSPTLYPSTKTMIKEVKYAIFTLFKILESNKRNLKQPGEW
jgi:hypothetical protein